jgi:nucleoside-diphosphate-sugar epimerase
MEYALAKLISEHILYDIANNNGLDFRICRPFNAIGEDQSPLNGFVVPIFFQNALTGQPLPVFYGGSQKRSFCHVADIVSALIVVQNQGRSKEVYNIGNPRDVISILSLAQEIVKICCSQSEILEVDPQVVYGAAYIEAAEKIPNIKKLQKHTGWFPTIDLASSLTRILDYYKIHEIGVPGHPKTSPIYVK